MPDGPDSSPGPSAPDPSPADSLEGLDLEAYGEVDRLTEEFLRQAGQPDAVDAETFVRRHPEAPPMLLAAIGAVATLERSGSTAFIDMAGNRQLVRTVHEHFGDALAFSLMVGMSHWRAARGQAPDSGPRVTPFFAPGRIQKRIADWGSAGLRQRTEAAWLSFVNVAAGLTDILCVNGPEAALQRYLEAVAGTMNPREAMLLDFG